MCEFLPHDETLDGAGTSVRAFVDEIAVALTSGRIYSPSHQRVTTSIEALERGLETLVAHHGGESIQIGAADGYLFHDERPLLGASRSATRLLRVLDALESGGLVFRRGTTAAEFRAFVDLANRRDLEGLDLASANGALTEAGAGHIAFLGAYAAGQGPVDFAAQALGTAAAEGGGRHAVAVPERLYEHLFDHLTDILMRIVRGDLFLLGETKGHVEDMLQRLNDDAAGMMDAASRQVTRSDVFQFRHSIRVACLALQFSRALTDERTLLLRVGTAALLHDVGKAHVPQEVLQFSGRLTDEQFRAIQSHTTEGARILLHLPDADPFAAAIAFDHHRTIDHGGYPRFLHEVDLSAATRLVKICDVYEALTSTVRRYRAAVTPRGAYRIMMSMDGHFDRALLHRFIRVNGVYPAGSRVKLASGARGHVQGQTDDFDRPAVRLDGEDETRDLTATRHREHGPVAGILGPETEDSLQADQRA